MHGLIKVVFEWLVKKLLDWVSRMWPSLHRKSRLESNVLLVGIEKAGKTELLRSCFGFYDAPLVTTMFEVHQSKFENQKKEFRTNVADYPGRDLGILVKGFIEEQGGYLKPPRIKYGRVSSLIFVVDANSIEASLREWNNTAISAVLGMVPEPTLKYVCVFINKQDSIQCTDQCLIDHCKPIECDLKSKLKPPSQGGPEVEVVVASARTGPNHLLATIRRNSIALR